MLFSSFFTRELVWCNIVFTGHKGYLYSIIFDPSCLFVHVPVIINESSLNKTPQKQQLINTMPVYQGIKLSVVSQLELRIHPEFPHPESSQFTYRTRNVIDETSVSSFVTPIIAPDSKADRILGRSSTISVYIPSHPGKYFSLYWHWTCC